MNVMHRNEVAPDAHQQRERFWALIAPIINAWKAVILVPLLMGLATFVYFYSITKYRSESILRLGLEDVTILKSDRVLATVVDKAIATSIAEQASDVSLDVFHLSNDGDLYKVSVYLRSSTGADVVLSDVVDSLINVTKPTKERAEYIGAQLAILQEQKTRLVDSLNRINRAHDNMASPDAAASNGAASLSYIGEPFSALVGGLAATETAIANAEMQLKGTFTGADVILAPTEAFRVPNTIGPFVTLAAVIGFALASLGALVRDAWLRANDNANIHRIRGTALSRRPRNNKSAPQ